MTNAEQLIENLRAAMQAIRGAPVTYADAEKMAELIKGEMDA